MASLSNYVCTFGTQEQEGRLTTTGPSVRKPVVDGGPWKQTGPKLPSGKVSLASVKQLLLVAENKVAYPISGRGALLPVRLAGGRTCPLLPHIPHSLLLSPSQNEGQPRSYVVAKEWLTTQTVGVLILTRIGCLQRYCHGLISNHIWDSLHVLRVKHSAQFLATLYQLSWGLSVGESQTLLNLTTPSDS